MYFFVFWLVGRFDLGGGFFVLGVLVFLFAVGLFWGWGCVYWVLFYVVWIWCFLFLVCLGLLFL